MAFHTCWGCWVTVHLLNRLILRVTGRRYRITAERKLSLDKTSENANMQTVLHVLSSAFGPSGTEWLKIKTTCILTSLTCKRLHTPFGICWVGASRSPFHKSSFLSGSSDGKCSLSTQNTCWIQWGTSAREVQQKVTVWRTQRTPHL